MVLPLSLQRNDITSPEFGVRDCASNAGFCPFAGLGSCANVGACPHDTLLLLQRSEKIQVLQRAALFRVDVAVGNPSA